MLDRWMVKYLSYRLGIFVSKYDIPPFSPQALALFVLRTGIDNALESDSLVITGIETWDLVPSFSTLKEPKAQKDK